MVIGTHLKSIRDMQNSIIANGAKWPQPLLVEAILESILEANIFYECVNCQIGLPKKWGKPLCSRKMSIKTAVALVLKRVGGVIRENFR